MPIIRAVFNQGIDWVASPGRRWNPAFRTDVRGLADRERLLVTYRGGRVTLAATAAADPKQTLARRAVASGANSTRNMAAKRAAMRSRRIRSRRGRRREARRAGP